MWLTDALLADIEGEGCEGNARNWELKRRTTVFTGEHHRSHSFVVIGLLLREIVLEKS